MDQMMTAEEITRELATLQQRLEFMAESLEDAQRFSDAHRLNTAIGYVEAVRRTLEDEGQDGGHEHA